MARDSYQLTSGNGGYVINDTAAHTPDKGQSWQWLQVIGGNAVVAAITDSSITNASDITGLTLTDGTIIYGNITSIQLTSGVVYMSNRG